MNYLNEGKPSMIEEEFVPLSTVADLGTYLRAHRKARKLTLQDAAALAGCSIQFLHDLETGKPTIRMGRALEYAQLLGLRLHASGPQLSTPAVSTGTKSRKRRPGL